MFIIMNRERYDRKTLVVFDTIGSYFVDVFYNTLYSKSVELVNNGHAGSITDTYRSNLLAYYSAISKNDKYYLQTMQMLHEYYGTYAGLESIMYVDFEDVVLSKFIPPEFYRDFTSRNKAMAMFNIISSVIGDFVIYIIEKDGMLSRIIDDHNNRNNVVILQQKITDLFILQREIYYEKFARAIIQNGPHAKVDKDILNRTHKAYVELSKKYKTLSADYKALSAKYEKALCIINILNDKIKQYKQNPGDTPRVSSRPCTELVRTCAEPHKLNTPSSARGPSNTTVQPTKESKPLRQLGAKHTISTRVDDGRVGATNEPLDRPTSLSEVDTPEADMPKVDTSKVDMPEVDTLELNTSEVDTLETNTHTNANLMPADDIDDEPNVELMPVKSMQSSPDRPELPAATLPAENDEDEKIDYAAWLSDI